MMTTPTTPTTCTSDHCNSTNSNSNSNYNDTDTSLHLPVDIVPINKCSCCVCTKQGTIALETKFDKTILFKDDQNNNTNNANNGIVGVQFRCQNKSTANVGSVLVQLIETIEWTSNGHTESIRTILAESKKDASLYPELDALRRKPRNNSSFTHYTNSNTNSDDDEEVQHMLLQYKTWHTMGPLVVPSHATDTYSRGTGAIQVRHSLNVELKTTGWCTTNPDMSSLVEIYRNQPTTAMAATTALTPTPVKMGVTTTTTPSAPFEDEFSSTTTFMSQQAAATTTAATAPSDVYDYDTNIPSYGYGDKTYNSTTTSIPTTEAQLVLLPEDWNAQTAEIVNIPMAKATIILS